MDDYDALCARLRGNAGWLRDPQLRSETIAAADAIAALVARVKELEAFRIGYDNLMRQRDAFHARAEAAEARVKELEAIDLGAAR